MKTNVGFQYFDLENSILPQKIAFTLQSRQPTILVLFSPEQQVNSRTFEQNQSSVNSELKWILASISRICLVNQGGKVTQ